jgi:hypothetical protein
MQGSIRAAPRRTIMLGTRARHCATREAGVVRAVRTRARANQSALIRAFGRVKWCAARFRRLLRQNFFAGWIIPFAPRRSRAKPHARSGDARFNAAARSRHALQKGPFYRHFCAISDFPQQILSSKIFAPEHWRGERAAHAVAPSAATAIHKIKRDDCSFFATGVMRIAVQIDSRLHCSNVAIH